MPSSETLFSNQSTTPFAAESDTAARMVSEAYKHICQRLDLSYHCRVNHYHCYPYFFRDAFPKIGDEQVITLSIAGVLYLDQLCMLDKLVDQPSGAERHLSLLATMVHEKAFAVLRQIFSSDNGFWEHLASLNLDHGRAVLDEKRYHQHRLNRFAKGDFYALATQKAGVSKATHIALAYLSGDFSPVESLSRSQDCFNAAFQAYDDVKDWKEDLKHGNYTNLLTTVLMDYHTSESSINASDSSVNDLSHSIYYGGYAENILQEAMQYCSQAIDAVDNARLPQWVRFVQLFRDRIGSLHNDLKATRLQTLLRSQGFLKKEPRILLADGIAVLEKDRARNYAEACHTMGFLWNTPDRNARESQRGSVFQRAIVADVLLDLDDCGLLNYRSSPLGAVADCEMLLAERLEGVRGGWSYFPSLDNLPPDADDLAQVMQVVSRSQFRATEIIEDAIDILFEHGIHGDGSFETWIVDPTSTHPSTCRFLHGIENYWGKGADVEVVSNLGYALFLFDKVRYSAEIRAAARYVESQQQHNGHWTPTWYASCWYGTYTATRFLAAVAPESDSLKLSAALLPSEQQSDDGYGVATSTPLETAFALLTICSLNILDNTRDKIYARAIRYFQMSVRPDGSWDSSPFIEMDTHRASKGKPDYIPNIVHYGSRTISTAYVVKALLVTDTLTRG